ncbi:hypothetical protein CDEST_02209 [Colletotrichum destructivum]|uniref:Uncharacterized protein n=1 Tax=Colletotrichum destructivum TaxID=34406 RepID=A0AAX4I1U3_9PEZI|nr:hypothetical protein CDEST_02209 [Colletotrichum destructivum]
MVLLSTFASSTLLSDGIQGPTNRSAHVYTAHVHGPPSLPSSPFLPSRSEFHRLGLLSIQTDKATRVPSNVSFRGFPPSLHHPSPIVLHIITSNDALTFPYLSVPGHPGHPDPTALFRSRLRNNNKTHEITLAPRPENERESSTTWNCRN